MIRPIRLLFTNAPGPDSEFIEAEDTEGNGIKVGEWSEEGEFTVLTIMADVPIEPFEGESEEDFGARKGRLEAAALAARKGTDTVAVPVEEKAKRVWS